jgi:heme exporter protein B
MSALVAALRKDLLLQWRRRGQAFAIAVFGASTLLLFSFAVAGSLRQSAAGFLWLAILLAGTLALGESFDRETDEDAMGGLLLLPASPGALYYGKALANWALLALTAIALTPVTVILYDAGTTRLVPLLATLLLGTAGLSAPGTLYAAMTARTRGEKTLLPLLFFPMVVPVLVASAKATSLAIAGDPLGQLRSWATLLLVFDAVHWALGGLLFGRVVED